MRGARWGRCVPGLPGLLPAPGSALLGPHPFLCSCSPTCVLRRPFSTRPLTLPPAPLPSCRNLSSADAGRQTMRNYTGLIDALMAYVQNCVAASRCDDKVTGWPQLAPPLGATAGLRAQPVPWLLSPVPVGTWLSDPDRTPPGGPGRQDTGRGGLCVQTPGWSPRGKGGLLEQRLAGCRVPVRFAGGTGSDVGWASTSLLRAGDMGPVRAAPEV